MPKKQYNEGGSVSTRPTRSGAQQYVRNGESVEAARERLRQEARRLGLEGFRERYGRSYRSVLEQLGAAGNAERAENLRGRLGNDRENAFDRIERSQAENASQYNKGGDVKKKKKKGYAKGGMVKTGSTDRRGGMFYKSESPRGYK